MAVRANPNLTQRTLMVAGMAVVIIAGMVVSQVWQTYDAAAAASRRDIQQLTQILEASTVTTFRSMELIMDHAAEKIIYHEDASRPRSALAGEFIAIAGDWTFIHSVAHIGTDGMIRAAAIRRAEGKLHVMNEMVDVSKQQLFLIHKDRTASARSAVYIARAGHDVVSREWVITLTKAVYGADGSFRGVCVVTVSLDAFTQLFAALKPARYSAVELFRLDGALLFSTAHDRPTTSNETFLFKEMIPSSPSGVLLVTSPTNDGDHFLSYRVLQRYPIVITARAPWSVMMARWSNASFVLAMSALTGILVIGALTWWLVRRIAAEHVVQRALVKSERSLAESQRLSGTGHFERNLRTGQTVWAATMFDVHGVDPARFNPNRESFIKLVVPEDQAKVREAWGTFEAPPPSGNIECRITLPSGQLRHVRYSWQTLDDGSGSPSRIFGVAQDVTAIRNAENIIRDDEERLRDIVECSSDYIWEVDADGIITLFTGAGVDQFGDVVGSKRTVFTDRAVNAGDVPALHRAMRDRIKFRSLVVPAMNVAGELRWVRISGNPRFDAEGRFLGYRGAGADVTELRRQQERDEDQRKAEALGRLASGMAHEINNLLQPILIYANFGVSQSSLAANVRQYFSRIGRAAEGATQIVRNVLTFARQSPPSRENINVLEVVRETVDLIGGTLPSAIALTIAEDANALTVRVDRTGLAQVLTNLLTNAAEAVPAGGRIGVSVRAIDLSGDAAKAVGLAPGVYCRLAVEDNGSGIPVDQIGKVFDPFFTTKPQGKGTGLGLSVVLGLAKSWGGTAAVESAAGARTCFIVYLPLAELLLQAAQ